MTRAVNTAAVGIGGVIQVVQTTFTAYATFASSSYVDTGLTATITPTSNTSRILVVASINNTGKYNGNTYGNLRILRDATVLQQVTNILGYNNSTAQVDLPSLTFSWVDSPATVAPVTYKIQVANANGVGYIMINNYFSTNNASVSSLLLMEVAA